MELFRLLGKIVIDGLDDADSKLSKISERAKKVGEKLEGAGDKISSVGKKILPVTAAIGGISVSSAKMAIEFEDSMAEINTLLDDDSHLEGYENAVKRLSNDTGIDLSLMTSGMYQAISSLGDNGSETEKIFETMSKASKAGGAEVSDSVALISAAMKGYNDVSDETANKISDLAFQTAKLGVTTFPEMAKSMQPLFPVANSLKLSYEDLFGSMATLTGVTGNTAEVSTQLEAVFSNLMSPTTAMQKMIEKYGYSSGQAMLESEGFAGMLRIVQEEAGGQSDKMSELFSSVEAVTAMTALTGSQFDTFNYKLSEMGNAAGSTESAYGKLETKGDRLRKTWNKLKNTGVELGGTIMEMLSPFVDILSDKVSKLSEWWSGLDDSQQKAIIKMAGIVAAIGPVITVIGKVTGCVGSMVNLFGKLSVSFSSGVKGIKNIKEAFVLAKAGMTGFASQTSIVGTALAGITAPMLAVVAVVGVLVAAFVHLWNTNEDFRKKITEIWEGIQGKFTEAFDKITEAINSLGFDFENLGEAISAAWDWLCNALAPIIVGIFEYIGGIIGGIVDLVTGVVQIICGIIQGFKDGDWSLFVEGLETLFTGFLELITAPFIAIWETFKGYLESFGTTWDEVWNGICEFFIGIWESISGFISETWEAISSFVSEKVEAVVTTVTTKFEEIRTKISNKMNAVWSKVTGIWNSIKTTFTTKISSIVSTVKDKFEEIKTSITEKIESAKNKVKEVIDAIKGFFNFDFEWPDLKMPHFSVEPSGWKIGDLIKGEIPSLGIEWYAKGGVLKEPTAFGINGNRLMAGGEAGPEAVAPIDVLQNYVAEAVASRNTELIEMMNRLIMLLENYMPELLISAKKQIVLNNGVLVGELAPEIDREIGGISSWKERGNR